MKRLKGFITNSSSTSFIMNNDGFIYSTNEFIELAEELKYALAGISLKYDYIPNVSLNSLKVNEKDVIRFVNSTLNVDVNDIEIIDKRIKGNKSSEISFCQKYDNRPFIEYMELLASFVDIYTGGIHYVSK